ncbi:GGDEF domain-containing protein [Paucibacter sp. TC2R-5]|uniref:GGDEF domain-containing protein n=1 Tax=Paucibacter sp. TC2R-5 TaxID=2893555 RepID=UPI0021E3A479|nr:GGDEF domain-containing protein [Paucibacter sp. TC2R-5]MCV2359882.1 GGDEF domain-containing protein [Paucibacter sp. TC2R-5]
MQFDNPTLFNLALLQALSSTALLLLLMGWRPSPAAERGHAFMGLQALGWLLLAGANLGHERLWLSLAMAAFSASLSALWWALQRWLKPHPGRALALLAPLLMPLIYGLQFEDLGFRAAWALYWLSLQLGLLVLCLVLPNKSAELHDILSKAPPEAGPSSDTRRWRSVLLAGVLPLLMVCLWRASSAAFGAGPSSLMAPGAANSALALAVLWGLGMAALAIVLAWRGEAEAELAHLAQTDRLTGLSDNRAFAARSVDMISAARRHQEELALMLLEIDNFKAIEAEHGAAGAERALALFSSCVQAQMRLGDLAGRIGAENFGLLMDRCELQGPQAMDQRLRNALNARAQAELGYTLNFSAGWAKLRHGDRNIDDLMRRAETALYEAKRGGHGQLQAEPGLET